MRVLFLTKRQYTGKDLLVDRYGRLYELPVALRAAGHDVTMACLSYRRAPEPPRDPGGGVTWSHAYVGALRVPGVIRHALRIERLARAFRPDAVVGASDAIQVILAQRLARRIGVPFVADLYDNFESYPLTRLPGVREMFRRALAGADAISVVSRPLQDLIARDFHPPGGIAVIENAVPAGVFAPGDRARAREKLGLPERARIVGTAGALYRARGIEALFEAFRRLCAQVPDLHLALAGPTEAGVPIPRGDNVHYLGNLDYASVPDFFNALDVGVICAQPDPFGLYCFPQKAYEMLACGTPLIAARVGALARLFEGWPDVLYAPGDPDAIARGLRMQLKHQVRVPAAIPEWPAQGRRLEALIRSALEAARA